MTVAAGSGVSVRLPTWVAAVVLAAAGMLAALTETVFPSIFGTENRLDAIRLSVGALGLVLALLAANQFWHLPWRKPSFTIALAFLGCLAAGWLAGVSWPNSGDEYSYTVLADTLLAGRLSNPAPPDPELFQNFHVLVNQGRTFSPYPLAWSALLVPFRALGIMWLANPLLTVLLGAALVAALGKLDVAPIVRNPALVLVLLTPFTLFLGGSLFPQTMACALVACIVWAQLADEERPRIGLKLLIGALFGTLLLSRPDVFAIVALAYAIDRVVARRLRVVADGLLVMLGALPFVACLAAYNAGVTGSPLQLTSTWVVPEDINVFGDSVGATLVHAGFKDLYWLGGLAQFGGLPVLVLAGMALVVTIRHRTCRFYDFLFPAAILFYSLVPFTGGHQYGPRYWFWAWPLSILTIARGLVDEAGYFRIGRGRVSFEGFTTACLVFATGAFCVLLVTTHAYLDLRRAVFNGPQPESRAIVLLPSRSLWVWPWQDRQVYASNRDFTRNGIDYDARVLFGRADAPDAAARACRLGREVYRWEQPGRLVPVACQ